MKIKGIVVALVSVAALIFSYSLIQSTKLTIRNFFIKPVRVLLFALTVSPDSLSSAREAVVSINDVIKKNPDSQRPIVLVEIDPDSQPSDRPVNSELIAGLLGSINGYPFFVFGEKISGIPGIEKLIEPAYESNLVNVGRGRTVQYIKADSNNLVSSTLRRTMGLASQNTNLESTWYSANEEPQVQYNWLSSLVGEQFSATLLVTQKKLGRIDEMFQTKLVNVVCSSPVSVYIYFSLNDDIFDTGDCPGFSYSMIGNPEHKIIYVGLPTNKISDQIVRYKEIFIDRHQVEIIDHKF